MNTTVAAKGMSVQAATEKGLVIANAAAGTYDSSATSVTTNVAQLFPGSTANLTTWFHSTSTNPGAANTQQEYTAGTAWENNTAKGNYVVHDFYIRSSGAETLTVSSLDIKSVTATVGNSAAAQELSKALRVGIKIGEDSTPYIYAPVTGHDTVVTIQPTLGEYASSGRSSVTPKESAATTNTSIASIPGNTAAGVHAYIYVWYEGEDTHCISNNILTNLEELSIIVEFTYTE